MVPRFAEIRLFIGALFCCLSLLISGISNANELSISVPKILPLFFDNDHPRKLGTITSRLDKILREAGYTANVQFLPWKRAELSAITGKTDGTVLWSNIGHLEGEFSISRSFMKLKVIFITHSSYDGPPINGYLDVANIVVGTLRGDTLQHELSGRGIPFTRLNSLKSGMQMLQAGRLGAFLVHKEPAMNYLKNNNDIQRFKAYEVGASPVYFAISLKRKDAGNIISVFNETLRRLHRQDANKY